MTFGVNFDQTAVKSCCKMTWNFLENPCHREHETFNTKFWWYGFSSQIDGSLVDFQIHTKFHDYSMSFSQGLLVFHAAK